MRKLIFAGFAALAMTGCAPMLAMLGGIPAAPSSIANNTRIDEQAALSVELAYQATSLAALTATRAGLITGETALRVAEADNKAYKAVVTVRAAYDAGNAVSYGAAASTAVAALRDLLSAIKGN